MQSTPVQDALPNITLGGKKLASNKMPDGLWPSTMRSLTISFQSDSFPVPISKKEKPLPKKEKPIPKKAETAADTRKLTPERKRSPLKGKNAPNQLENTKPLIEHHMWPSRTGRNLTNTLTRSIDLTDKNTNPLKKSLSDVAQLASLPLNECGSYKPVSSRFLTSGAKLHSLPATPGGLGPLSPSKAQLLVSRGVSPSRTRAMSSSTTRGVSPAHSRPLSPSRANSVLTFTADIKKAKKGVNHIEDAHELRLLYNRHLQWQFANARANAVLQSQTVTAETMLYNVCETTSELWEYVIEKRNELQQLRLRIKLHMVLKEQMGYLEDWSLCENNHSNSLSHAVEDLRSSILRLPVTGGAKGDIETVKAAVCSAVEVMRAMGSSISSVLARVEGMNSLLSELANIAARGRAMVDICDALLASIESLQVEEYSLRTHLIQMKEN